MHTREARLDRQQGLIGAAFLMRPAKGRRLLGLLIRRTTMGVCCALLSA
jgi:hypothetical protein